MSESENHLFELTLFVLGSPRYRLESKTAIHELLEAVDPVFTSRVLDRLNLAAQFYELLIQADICDQSWEKALSPLVALHKVIYDVAAREVKRIGVCLSSAGYEPIVLKGPACWHRLYPEPHVRRIKDIDLWIRFPDELLGASEGLESIGYKCNHPNTPELAYDPETVSLNVQAQMCRITVDESQTDLLLQAIAAGYRSTPVEHVSDNTFDVPLEVQIHKNPLLWPGGVAPVLSDGDIVPWLSAPGLFIMSVPLELPYLCTKFVFDLHFNTTKCTKLLGDVVRLLCTASDEEVAQSIAISANWKIASHYRRCLSLAKNLVPELQIEGIDCESINVIRPIVAQAISEASVAEINFNDNC